MELTPSFRLDYDSPVIRYGSGAVSTLDSELEELGCSRALVVCGQTVGNRPDVIEPVTDGLGDRLAGVFAGTTPKKRLQTVLDCAEQARDCEADVLVGVGGASSLDLARIASAVLASDRSPAELREELAATATLSVPEEPIPVVTVPTTLAGGSLSMLGGVSAEDEETELVGGGVGAPQLMPALAVYDPELVMTTPREILAGSAFNGFNKGVETLYASSRTPVTDATASRGLALLSQGLPTLGADTDPDRWNLETVLQGVVLAQYGASRPEGTTFSVLHALGHSLRVHTGVQLGVAHATITPAALEWLFGEVDGRRDLLADALGVDETETDPAKGVVGAIRTLRTALGLPTRLRDVDGVDQSMLEEIAQTAAENFLLSNDPPSPSVSPADEQSITDEWSGTPHAPPELEVSTAAMQNILESAW